MLLFLASQLVLFTCWILVEKVFEMAIKCRNYHFLAYPDLFGQRCLDNRGSTVVSLFCFWCGVGMGGLCQHKFMHNRAVLLIA